jgi:uncharacterized protein
LPDIEALLALNNAHAKETSFLNQAALSAMINDSFFSITHETDGLLIAFDQDADYDGINFHWFKARYPSFVYVDRVIIGPSLRGKGVGRDYYRRLFDYAKSAGHSHVTCEINIIPPNPVSMAFHDSLGFIEVGTAALENGKSVSYQQMQL